MIVGEPALPLVCYVVALVRERSLSLTFVLTTRGGWQSWPQGAMRAGVVSTPSLIEAFWRVGPAHLLGSRVELVMDCEFQLSLPIFFSAGWWYK